MWSFIFNSERRHAEQVPNYSKATTKAKKIQNFVYHLEVRFFFMLLKVVVCFLTQYSDIFIEELMDDVKHIIHLRKNAAVAIFVAGILFGLLLTPVIRLFAECLVNSFLQEPDTEQGFEDEGIGKDEVDEDDEEEKKER